MYTVYLLKKITDFIVFILKISTINEVKNKIIKNKAKCKTNENKYKAQIVNIEMCNFSDS